MQCQKKNISPTFCDVFDVPLHTIHISWEQLIRAYVLLYKIQNFIFMFEHFFFSGLQQDFLCI
jgi:hypothetical protein